MPQTLSFTLNGSPVRVEVDGDRKLLWVLRTELEQTGTKFGCGRGLCGTCAVLVNDRPVRSCIARADSVRGKDVVTIEGLARDGELHPLQKAFIEHDALQCGFCTPGMILTAYGLLRTKGEPSREEIIRAMDRNLCRCGAHGRIIEAIQSAAAEMKARGGNEALSLRRGSRSGDPPVAVPSNGSPVAAVPTMGLPGVEVIHS